MMMMMMMMMKMVIMMVMMMMVIMIMMIAMMMIIILIMMIMMVMIMMMIMIMMIAMMMIMMLIMITHFPPPEQHREVRAGRGAEVLQPEGEPLVLYDFPDTTGTAEILAKVSWGRNLYLCRTTYLPGPATPP